jgi:mRNA-degrading endonuclease RelE of RelBE toxin-antitoxin system
VASHRVVLTSSAEKELKELSAQLNARIVPRFENLASNPRSPSCKKLKGGDKE